MDNNYNISGDIAFINGEIITVNNNLDVLQALVIKDDTILFVGSDKEAKKYIGNNCKIINLKGKSLVPGFVDAHLHMAILGANEMAIDCRYPQVKSIEDIKILIKNEAAKKPKGTWIRGWGYDHSKLIEERHPTRWDLDEVSPDHPVIITRACAHISSNNSFSLQKAGITESTPSPDGGLIVKVNGMPNGVMKENAHMEMMMVAMLSQDEIADGLIAANSVLISQGITSIHDAGGYGLEQMRAMQKVTENNLIDIRMYPMIFSFHENDKFIKKFLDTGLYTGFGNEDLKIGPIKLMVDGSSSGPTAATFEAYEIDKENFGILALEQEYIEDMIYEAHKSGYQVTAHAIGDKAVSMVISAIKKALEKVPRDNHRHRIEHCAMVNDNLLKEIKELGIIPVAQPVFLYEFGDGYIKNYGIERAEKMFTVGSFLNRNILSAMSSDCPVTFSDPLFNIHMAVNRETQRGYKISQNERIGVMDAIKMYTYNGAFASFDEAIKGSLEEGKLADVAILSESILTVAPERIKDIKVEMTLIGGKIVYGSMEEG